LTNHDLLMNCMNDNAGNCIKRQVNDLKLGVCIYARSEPCATRCSKATWMQWNIYGLSSGIIHVFQHERQVLFFRFRFTVLITNPCTQVALRVDWPS
jgi:hypothetical protein